MQDEEPPSRRAALLALAVLALLVLGALWLTGTLHRVGTLQDCVMAGRRNCAPVGTLGH